MFQACRWQVGGLVMPKILTFNLVYEWSYEWRAHRQGHTNDFFVREIIHSGRVEYFFDSVS